MTDSSRFDPIFPSHAIERCGITVAFREALPEKAFQRAIVLAAEVTARRGLQQAPVGQPGISIDLATGKMGPIQGVQPKAFNLPDQSASLLVAPNVIIWQNSRYVRWAPFIGQFQDIALRTISDFLALASIAAVRLEYWDRFNWTGTWNDFDATRLIRPDPIPIASGWSNWKRQWHSHVGWFAPFDKGRRLTNINVDVGDMAWRPSVLIYTMMQDEPNVDGYGAVDTKSLDENFVVSQLGVVHRELKSLLGSVLQPDMSERISLNAEDGA